MIRRLNIPGLADVVILEWHTQSGQIWAHLVPVKGVAQVDAKLIADGINTQEQAKQIAGVFREGYWLAKPPTVRHMSVKLPGILHQM